MPINKAGLSEVLAISQVPDKVPCSETTTTSEEAAMVSTEVMAEEPTGAILAKILDPTTDIQKTTEFLVYKGYKNTREELWWWYYS